MMSPLHTRISFEQTFLYSSASPFATLYQSQPKVRYRYDRDPKLRSKGVAKPQSTLAMVWGVIARFFVDQLLFYTTYHCSMRLAWDVGLSWLRNCSITIPSILAVVSFFFLISEFWYPRDHYHNLSGQRIKWLEIPRCPRVSLPITRRRNIPILNYPNSQTCHMVYLKVIVIITSLRLMFD